MAARPESLHALIPDVNSLLALPPEELGVAMLKLMAPGGDRRAPLNRHNFIGTDYAVSPYPRERWPDVKMALAEAWAWLMRECLLVTDPDQGKDCVRVSRAGLRLAESGDLGSYRQAHLLPTEVLVPELMETGLVGSFLRGNYETAVFEAFKALEVAVREASGAGPELIGKDLMRFAFHKETGPLRQIGVVDAENEALGHLMAGAADSSH